MNKGDLTATILAALLSAVGLYGWHTEYMQPKQDVLMAASQCMSEAGVPMDGSVSAKSQWGQCFDEAHDKYGTRLLEVVGY